MSPICSHAFGRPMRRLWPPASTSKVASIRMHSPRVSYPRLLVRFTAVSVTLHLRPQVTTGNARAPRPPTADEDFRPSNAPPPV